MANRARAPNVPMWKRPKKDFLNNFLEVILQKPCNTHRHEYMEKLFKEYSKLLNRLYDSHTLDKPLFNATFNKISVISWWSVLLM
jgi:hypothetical protein